jgi:hypothetical protein
MRRIIGELLPQSKQPPVNNTTFHVRFHPYCTILLSMENFVCRHRFYCPALFELGGSAGNKTCAVEESEVLLILFLSIFFSFTIFYSPDYDCFVHLCFHLLFQSVSFLLCPLILISSRTCYMNGIGPSVYIKLVLLLILILDIIYLGRNVFSSFS